MKKETSLKKLEKVITEKVVSELKPEIKREINSIRVDLTNDFKEMLSKVVVSKPDVATGPSVAAAPPNLAGITDMLKSGNIDLGQISQMMGSIPTSADSGKLTDMKNLTEGQIEFMKMEQQNKMMMTFLPLMVGNQNNSMSGVMGEVMNRLVMDKINSGIYLEKMVVNKMVKDMGGQPMPMDTLSTPTSDMINTQTLARNSKNAV